MRHFVIVLFFALCYSQNNSVKFSIIQDAITPLPEDCIDTQGPHSKECLSSLWKLIGCVEEGQGYPEKMTDATFKVLSSLSLR